MVDGVLRARVAARAFEGAANQALIALLSDELRIARTRIAIVGGQGARSKRVELEGVDPEALRSRWPGLDV